VEQPDGRHEQEGGREQGRGAGEALERFR